MSDQQNALKVHNDARKSKGITPLQWDQGLANAATQYAKHLADISQLQHSSGTGQGENLYGTSSSKTPLADAAHGWLNEQKNYHGEKIADGNFGSYGHYTQCMWKSTTKVGMGQATGANGWVWVVGRYTPQGNWMGQTPY